LKKILVVLNNGAQISSVLDNDTANKTIDQFYNLCSSNIDDHCFELSVRNELDKLEHTLIPLRSILYVSCREHV
jgi:hypothetical protein